MFGSAILSATFSNDYHEDKYQNMPPNDIPATSIINSDKSKTDL